MGKIKKPIVTPIITTFLLIVMLLSATAALLKLPGLRLPGKWSPIRSALAKRLSARRDIVPANPITVRPASVAGVKSAYSIPNRRAVARKTRRCLNALCDTGASDAAVSETRVLAVQLDALSQPFAQGLFSVLKGILSYRSYRDAGSNNHHAGFKHSDNHAGSDNHAEYPAASLLAFPDVPADLIDRAAAACDARGRRRPGEIVLSFAGDCTFGTVNGDDAQSRFPAVYRRSRRIDYPFALMRPWFLNDDLTVVNFECTLTDAARTADKQWHFKGAAQYASIFPAGSVEAVGLSNNHSFDYLQAGFKDTVTNFRQAHVPVFYQNTPYITTLQGVETVIIGDCTVVGENTTKIDGVLERVIQEIKRYKKPDNIVIVVMHWGSELDTVPRHWQQELGRKFIDAGADAVVGHHPHVVQGIECYKGKYIAYSLGNFAFGGNSLARYPETFVLRLRFHAGGGKTSMMKRTSVMSAAIVPCWTTSGQARNAAGILRNNYQPKPVFGATADRTVALVLARSAGLMYGVKRVGYLKLQD